MIGLDRAWRGANRRRPGVRALPWKTFGRIRRADRFDAKRIAAA
ncbi:hypothetical protein [Sphingomonas sanxanigenens]|uniref:Uncharacterized protein n=1 Tax=Sphingomonas sanxanigenens DSM 19645 = NX02 TaxID=1123269 RepID=W0AK47_9SPHN|nr:hypothetical protein [Sphingomonas sanxanigenens]AHE56942.1 hypothetical protein NX02_26765 [Sphingomonas sanxanigenens DSM 19645 = NX02]